MRIPISLKNEDLSLEDLELELIDFGVDEVEEDEDEVVLYGEFAQNSAIQKLFGGEWFRDLE